MVYDLTAEERMTYNPYKAMSRKVKNIPLAGWKCSVDERKSINRVLDSGQLTYGQVSRELEERWSRYHGCEYGVICNSGTSALQLAFRALKEHCRWDNNAEVLVPTITFPATINMVFESQLNPVLCDTNEDGTILIDDMRRKLTHRTKCVCVVHLWGNPYPHKDKLLEFCKDNDLRLVEDSCETVGKEVGDWGDISCFSMYFNHVISAGVGGLACTKHKELNNIMRSLANHGMINTEISPKYLRYAFNRVGYSMRVTELEAALGLSQFKNIASILKKRKNIKGELDAQFKKHGVGDCGKLIGGLMMYPIVFRELMGLRLDNIEHHMDKSGIEIRRMLPIINQPVYKWHFNITKPTDQFPNAQFITNRGVFFPVNQYMTKADCVRIAKELAFAIKTYG